MNKQSQAAPLIARRKADFLPQVFVSPEFDRVFLKRMTDNFSTLLTNANKRDKSWTNLLEILDKHEFLVVKVPREVDFPAIDFVVPDGKGGTRKVTSESKTLDFGWEHFKLEIDRTRLLQPAYLAETASILAYMFCWRLFTRPLEGQDFALTHLNAAALSDFLRLHHRGEFNLDILGKFLIARVIESELSSRDILNKVWK